jgi:NAD(P)-dependent dehydrogenase (short-subunit alcohol dehydrogenase family)
MQSKNVGDGEAVVVTGASSGIGRATAILLAEVGYHVFAGVRKEADGDALRQSTTGALTPLLIDVTDDAAVGAAVSEVSLGVGQRGLAGLVNNAGVGVAWPMEVIPVDALRRVYDVNVFGQVAVIQAFLPLLRPRAGRIVNIGSVGDRLTLPFGAPLTSSKWAFASITEALRLELHPWGIHVVLVEPASIMTSAVGKLADDAERVVSRMDELERARYADTYRSMVGTAVAQEKAGSKPEVVALVVLRALTTRRPATRYLVGKHARMLAFAARWLPDRMFDRMRIKLFGLPEQFGGMRAGDGAQDLQTRGDSRS